MLYGDHEATTGTTNSNRACCPESFSFYIEKTGEIVLLCTSQNIYLSRKVSKIWTAFSLSICVSGITLYLEYEQYLGLLRVQYV